MKNEETGPEVFQIKITLDGVKPPIWRRVLVPAHLNLADLHFVIQDVMGWENDHLHEFMIAKESYGPISDEIETEWLDESEFTLDELFARPKATAKYTYDFGDSWIHTIKVEKWLPFDAELDYPLCIGGERACPPEDCGGTHGYLLLVKAIANRDVPANMERLQWVGDWDPEHFDVDEANERLLDGEDSFEDFEDDYDGYDGEGLPDSMSNLAEESAFRVLYYMRQDAKTNYEGAELEAVLARLDTMSPDLVSTEAAKVIANHPEELAQLFGIGAFTMEDPDDALRLAQDSLRIDPENSDALLVVASMSEDVNERIPLLREALEKAEQRLATTPYVTDSGDELANIFVLPYLRAAVILLASLLEAEDAEGAAMCVERALKGDPDDRHHTRVKLLQVCLVHRDLNLSRKVLSTYLPDDNHEYDELLWGRILERYLAGDIGGASDTLKLARKRNPFAELCYTGDYTQEPESPEEEELDFEANRFHASIGYAWESHPLALAWLRAECARK